MHLTVTHCDRIPVILLNSDVEAPLEVPCKTPSESNTGMNPSIFLRDVGFYIVVWGLGLLARVTTLLSCVRGSSIKDSKLDFEATQDHIEGEWYSFGNDFIPFFEMAPMDLEEDESEYDKMKEITELAAELSAERIELSQID
ncbi:hypothetical protein F5146DRAFT_999174 [Armillaria mellea]|nr:hypothetical protein F5146DRAFT_999174 [Armillaria mellea]